MTDFDSLTREQLVELLKQKSVPAENVCKYIFLRSREPCTSKATTPFGFCSKHVSSSAGKEAKAAYEKSITPPVVPEPEPLVEPELAVVESVVEKQPQQSVKSLKQQKVPETPYSKKLPDLDEEQRSSRIRPPPPKQKKTIIKTNKWGNFEDADSGILFDPKSRKAFGVQDHKTGRIFKLTSIHKELCRRNGWAIEKIEESSSSESEESESGSDSDSEESGSESESEESESGSDSEESGSEGESDSEDEN